MPIVVYREYSCRAGSLVYTGCFTPPVARANAFSSGESHDKNS